MDKQSYRIELMVPEPEKEEFFNKELIHLFAKTFIVMEMTTVDKFSQRELFFSVLHEVFTTKFGEKFVKLSGKYHPASSKMGPRYDLGVSFGEGDEGLYLIQIELIGVPDTSATLH